MQVDSAEYMFTSESVTEGHPNKIADQLSDAVLDAALAADPNSRVACETLVTTGLVVLVGEITAPGMLDYTRRSRVRRFVGSGTTMAVTALMDTAVR